jgi:hypothetical protein
MLDLITALSVAAAVVQFVDFGAKIQSKGKELYAERALFNNLEHEEASSRLSIMSKSLAESLHPSTRPLTERD